MILIAIPKSASTALMKTMEKYHSLKGVQQFLDFKNKPYPKECNFLHIIHSDIRDLSENDLSTFYESNIFYKQHIFPSENNLSLFKGKKKVVLLREVHEILLAYKRGAKSKVQNLLSGFDSSWTDDEWTDHAEKIGLKKDLENFYNRWYNLNDGETLIIHYKNLVDNPITVINEVERFYGLRISNSNIELVKARYSRATGLERYMHKIKKLMVKGYLAIKK